MLSGKGRKRAGIRRLRHAGDRCPKRSRRGGESQAAARCDRAPSGASGQTEASKEVIRYLYETYGDQIYISILNQYTPMPGVGEAYPELGRKLTQEEYDSVVDYAIETGVENGFIQEGETASESFIPAFDITGI